MPVNTVNTHSEVSAEDMRGQEKAERDAPRAPDLRETPEAAGSYVVWNIEDLGSCPALQGRQFDLVVSWVTFCWLTDPFGALEYVRKGSEHGVADGSAVGHV